MISKFDDLFFDLLVRGYVEENPRFLRREWLAADLEKKLSETDKSFVLLTAEPGAGKTVFISQLAHDHPDWLRYFIRRDQREVLSDVSSRSMLLRIGYQLAASRPILFSREQLTVSVKQRIGYLDEQSEAVGVEVEKIICSPFYKELKVFSIDQEVGHSRGKLVGLRVKELNIEERLLSTEDLFDLALIEPARVLKRLEPLQILVILIDALDEISYHSTKDNILAWLTNCPKLPDNIRFVLTSRPQDEEVRFFSEKVTSRIAELDIVENNVNVTEDIDKFVTKLIQDTSFVSIISETPDGMSAFVHKVKSKAQGNLGYLDAIARGIDHARIHNNGKALNVLINQTELPPDLESLYAFFLYQIKISIRHNTTWQEVYYPIFGILSVAMEPLDLDQLIHLGNIRTERAFVSDEIHRLLGQFLEIYNGKYRLYHATLAEFLTSDQTRSNSNRDMFYQNAKQLHEQIANFYIKKWGGWDTGFAGLSKNNEAFSTHLYGVTNIVNHLALLNDWETVKRLVIKFYKSTNGPLWQPLADTLQKNQGHYSGYLRNLLKLWQWTESNRDIGTAVSSAIIASSIYSQSSTIPPKILVGLVTIGTSKGCWTLNASIEYAKYYVDPNNKAEFVLGLLASGINLDWQILLNFVLTINDQPTCGKVCTQMAKLLPFDGLSEFLSASKVLLNFVDRKNALQTLINNFAERDETTWHILKNEVLDLINFEFNNLIIQLAKNVPQAPNQEQYVTEIFGIIRGFEYLEDCVQGLYHISSLLPQCLWEDAHSLLNECWNLDNFISPDNDIITLLVWTRIALNNKHNEANKIAAHQRERELLEEILATSSIIEKFNFLCIIRDKLCADHKKIVEDEIIALLVGKQSNSEFYPEIVLEWSLEKKIISDIYGFADNLIDCFFSNLKNDFTRYKLILLIAPYLSSEWKLTSTHLDEIAGHSDFLNIISALSRNIPANVMPSVFSLYKLQDRRHREDHITCLTTLIPYLPEYMLEEVIVFCETELWWNEWFPRLLPVLRGKISNDEYDNFFDQAVESIIKIDKMSRQNYIIEFAPYLNEDTLTNIAIYKDDIYYDFTKIAKNIPCQLLPKYIEILNNKYSNPLYHSEYTPYIETLCQAAQQTDCEYCEKINLMLQEAFRKFFLLHIDSVSYYDVKRIQEYADFIPQDQIYSAWQFVSSHKNEKICIEAMEALIHRLPKENQQNGYDQLMLKCNKINDCLIIYNLIIDLVKALPNQNTSILSPAQMLINNWLESVPSNAEKEKINQHKQSRENATAENSKAFNFEPDQTNEQLKVDNKSNETDEIDSLVAEAAQTKLLEILNGETIINPEKTFQNLATELPHKDLPRLYKWLFKYKYKNGFNGYQEISLIRDKYDKSVLLTNIARRIDKTYVRDIVKTTLELLYDFYVSMPVLEVAVARLYDEELTNIAIESLQLPDYIIKPHAASVLISLGRYIPDLYINDGLELVEQVFWSYTNKLDRLDLYLALNENRSGEAADKVWKIALDLVFNHYINELKVWDKLLNKLPAKFFSILFELMIENKKFIKPETYQRIFVEMARSSPENELSDVFKRIFVFLNIEDKGLGEIYKLIALRGPNTLLFPVLHDISKLPNCQERSQALMVIASRLKDTLDQPFAKKTEHIEEVLKVIGNICILGRPELLSSLTELIPWLISLISDIEIEQILETLVCVSERWN